jgi:hypothetical protein
MDGLFQSVGNGFNTFTEDAALLIGRSVRNMSPANAGAVATLLAGSAIVPDEVVSTFYSMLATITAAELMGRDATPEDITGMV